MTFNTYKKGTTKADVYVKKTKVGTVKIKVGSYKPYTDLKKNTFTFKYNSRGRAQNIYEADIKDYLRNFKSTDYDKLTFKTNSKYIKYDKNSLYPFTTKKTGTTKISIYLKGKKLITVKAKIKKGTMAEVFKNNLGGDSDADFLNYENGIDISQGEKHFDLFNEINSIVLNNKRKGTHFDKSDYKITYTSRDTSAATIDSNGIVTAGAKALDKGSVDLVYTIKFADSSTYTGTYYLLLQ